MIEVNEQEIEQEKFTLSPEQNAQSPIVNLADFKQEIIQSDEPIELIENDLASDLKSGETDLLKEGINV
jgi:hypothetical protein